MIKIVNTIKCKLVIGVAVVLMAFMAMAMVACGNGDVTRIEVVGGTFSYPQYYDMQFMFKDIKVKVYLSGNKSYVVNASDVFIDKSKIDTDIKGEQEIIVEYKGVSVTRPVYISDDDKDYTANVIGYEQDPNIVEYENNRKGGDGEWYFAVTDLDYSVGVLNPWTYFPRVTVYDANHNIAVVSRFGSDYQVTDLATNQVLDDNARDELVSVVDSARGVYQWSEKAAGKQYKFTISPNRDIYANIDMVEQESTSVVVNIVEGGYNVRTVAELSVVDNSHIVGVNQPRLGDYELSDDPYYTVRDDWHDIKFANKVPYDEQDVRDIKAVIMHKDINITKNDIPTKWFYDSDRTKLKNNIDIFKHTTISVDDSFSVLGNYFALTAQDMPIVPRGSNASGHDGYPDYSYARSFVFAFYGNSGLKFDNGNDKLNYDYINNPTKGAKQVIRDIKSIGNAKRSNDRALFGGLSFIKSGGNFTEFVSDNILSNSWMTTWQFKSQTVSRVIEHSKVYENFNFALELYDCGDTNSVYNSEFKRSGGPIIGILGAGVMEDGIKYNGEGWAGRNIRQWAKDNGELVQLQDNWNQGQNPATPGFRYDMFYARKALATIDSSTVIENWVTGTEAWFDLAPGGTALTLLGMIKNLSQQVLEASNGRTHFMSKAEDGITEVINFVSAIVPVDPGDGNPLNGQQWYNWLNEPFIGGLKFIDNKDSKIIVNDFDMGSPLIWRDRSITGDTVSDYVNNSSQDTLMENQIVRGGGGVSRDSFGVVIGAYPGSGDSNKDKINMLLAPKGNLKNPNYFSDSDKETIFSGQYMMEILFGVGIVAKFA